MNKELSRERFLRDCKDFFRDCYIELKDKKIVLFGAGSYGKLMIMGLKDIGMYDNICALCDNDKKKWGGKLENISIRNIKDVVAEIEDFVVIISSQFDTEIRQSLAEYDLNIFERPEYEVFVEQMLSYYVYKTTIIYPTLDVYTWIGEYYDKWQNQENEVMSLMMDDESKDVVRKRIEFYKTGELKYITKMPVNYNEYFDKEYYSKIGNDEVFVDCGAYRGDTIEGFIQCVKNQYSKIYAFEPDTKNASFIAKMQSEKIKIYNYATGKEDGIMHFSALGTTGSYVTDEGEVCVEVKCLDNLISDKVTWVKMDIEGSEYATLQGMERIIKTYKPKLAICIYHKVEDLFTIPKYIHSLVPQYKLKIRQNHDSVQEMVLYADIY